MEFSEENIVFWKACQEYKSITGKKRYIYSKENIVICKAAVRKKNIKRIKLQIEWYL